MPRRVLLGAGITLAAMANAHAQATLKMDDTWRYAFGAGLSYASGNSRSSTLSLSIDGVRASSLNKWSFAGRYLRGTSEDTTTADQTSFTTRYDKNLVDRWFSFAQGDYLRDRPANLASRFSGAGGLGRHLYQTEDTMFDLFAGVGYTYDSYITPTSVEDQTRAHYGHPDLLLGEEFTHKLTETASFRQKLVVYPNLAATGSYRAVFDSGLSVSINKLLSLTATLGYRYNSDPGDNLKKGDLLFITGLSVKTD